MGKSGRRRRPSARGYARRARSAIGGTIPLSKSLIIVGGVLLITGYGEAQSATVINGVKSIAADAGLGMEVTGSTIVLGSIGLRAACFLFPRFGSKVRAFLKGYGLRP